MADTQTNIDERIDALYEWIAESLVNNAINEAKQVDSDFNKSNGKETYHFFDREAS